MLLRLATVLVVTACLLQHSEQQRQMQQVATDQSGALLQLAAPVAAASATSLQKRNTNNDNTALATGFTGGHHHHGHHHAGHHLGAAGGGAAGLGHGHHGHGKFFMYAHQPEHKHYEFGFKRGNDKHVVERYEKGGPHHNFKSKFRWHDKHGGHGERYWDYNHGDHHHGGDGGHKGADSDQHHHHHDEQHHHDHDDHHHHHDGGHHGYHSEPVPEFVQPGSASAKDAYRHRRKSSDNLIKKTGDTKKPTGMEKKPFFGPKEQQLFKNQLREANTAAAADDTGNINQSGMNDMLGFDPFSPPDIMKSHSSVGGISADSSTNVYRPRVTTMPAPIAKPYFSRNSKSKKNKPKKYKSAFNRDSDKISAEDVPKLAFDLDSGRVYDEKTGKWFRLVAD